MSNVNNLTYSPAGLKLTEQFEGLQLTAYKDVAGVWTNGYGNTHNVVPGSTITMEQAVADLTSNVEGAEFVVNRVVTVPLNQNQFDALVDFIFNLGSANFQSSTLLRLLNGGDYSGAANEFPKWNHAGGVVVDGLTKRRLAEQALFDTVPAVNTQPDVPGEPAGVPSESVSPQTTISSVVSDIEQAITDLQNKFSS
jgi:lysozyme